MKTLLTISLVLVSAMLIAAPASATVIWDGSGNITTQGYTLSGATAMSYDTENGSPHIGTMYENSSGASSYYSLNNAASELVNATGWTVETRVQTLANNPGYSTDMAWDNFFGFRDNTGGFGLWLYPTEIHVGPGDWSGVTKTLYVSSDYHTIRAVVAPVLLRQISMSMTW